MEMLLEGLSHVRDWGLPDALPSCGDDAVPSCPSQRLSVPHWVDRSSSSCWCVV